MTKIKRLATTTDLICRIDPNITSAEMKQREEYYNTLSDKKMKTTYINYAFRPVYLHWKGRTFDIQLNYCSDPFCKNFIQPQINYGAGKTNRYKFTGKDNSRAINCVPDPTDFNGVPTLGCYTKTFSNWSLATEIERLIRINSIVPLEPDYEFHKDD